MPDKKNLSDEEILASLSDSERAIVEATMATAQEGPVTLNVNAYKYERTNNMPFENAAQLARHLHGLKGEVRQRVLQNLSGQLLAAIQQNV
jgi:hypothetical protein